MKVGWRTKAALQGVLSYAPRGGDLNYLLQRKVSRSLPVSDSTILEYLETAGSHVGALSPYLDRPLGDARFYEFGAGWTLGTALALSGLGVKTQTLVDIRPLARAELISDTVGRLIEKAAEDGLEFDLEPWPDHEAIDSALGRYGITYLAPVDARSTGLQSGSFDVVTSTSAWEHIPPRDLALILEECTRLLDDGGLISSMVDYKDHYATFDDRIGAYNFLQFSDRVWRFYSPPLHNQNRMRHSDYLQLVESAGLELLSLTTVGATQEDLAALEQVPIHSAFAVYDAADLAVKDSHFVLATRGQT